MEEEDKKSQEADISKEIEAIEGNATQSKKVRLMPRKREFRSRAHINPLNETEFPTPLNPDYVNWRIHYPKFFGGQKEEYGKVFTNTQTYPITYEDKVDPMFNGANSRKIDFLDIGCGFGGLLFELSGMFPEKLAFGLEIRPKLVTFIGEKIRAYRLEQDQCHNIAAIRTNSMRHLLQYIRKASVEKVFICFPDPQFKARNFRRRIINTGLLSEYAYIMKPKAILYTITDVKDLYLWHLDKIKNHNMFRILSEDEYKDDPCAKMIKTGTEESKKVDVKQGDKYVVVAQRI